MERYALDQLEHILLPALHLHEPRTDALSAAVLSGLAILQRRLDDRFPDRVWADVARDAGGQVDARHKAAFYGALSSAVGVEVVAAEGFRGQLLDAWVAENVSLIKSVREGAHEGMRREIERAFATGTRSDVLVKQWRREGLPLNFGTLRGRAEVIARDQVATLNGRLTQARQENAGITEYIWRAVGDGRVRDEHASLSGRRFRWDAPGPDGHPGEAVLCRCTAEAVVDLDQILGAPSVITVQPVESFTLPIAASPF